MGYTYVISDIHGQLSYFEAILNRIDLRSDDRLYVLGDVIDRGTQGIEILRRIMNMPNAEMLLGNHEFMMLNALGEPYDDINRNISECSRLWYRNGGGVTHMKWLCLSEHEQNDIIGYLKSLPLNIDTEVCGKQYRLVHAADTEFYPQYMADRCSLAEYSVWERKALIEMAGSDRNYVFGHTGTVMLAPSAEPKIWIKENLIGIDCGCAIRKGYYVSGLGVVRGRLGCIRLDDMKEYYSDDTDDENTVRSPA